jgi:regulator of sigma E protease
MLLLEIIIGLLVLVFLVVVHELGHAVAARRNGVVVEEFGIGFPPRAWGRKLKNGVLLSLNWLPLGGFVKLQGEHDAATEKGDYGAATFWQKTKILLAGVMINWLVAAGLLTILAWTGLPKVLPNQFTVAGDTSIDQRPVEVQTLTDKSPAQAAGLKVGDGILRFAGEPVNDTRALVTAAKANAGKTVEIIYSRGGVEYTTKATLKAANTQGEGFLGVGPVQRTLTHSTWSAPIVGVVTTLQFTGATFQGLGDLVANLFSGLAFQLSPDSAVRETGGQNLAMAGASVAGPIGVLGVIFPAAERAGVTQLVLLTAIISLSLAVMNTLPVPALDGGRWFVTAIFKLLQKPLTKEREEKIQATGFMILMLLILIVTIADVRKFF